MTRLSRFGLVSAVLVALALPANAAYPVFDAANYIENLLQAARALQQISNQVRQLENEARMLENMARNVASLDFNAIDRLRTGVAAVQRLIGQAEGIAYEVTSAEAEYARLYPREYTAAITSDELVAQARQRWGHSVSALGDAVAIHAQVAQNVVSDERVVADLVDRSQGAVGILQATQAGNQLLALQSKQLLQLQQMLAVQGRAETLEMARQTAAQEQAREQLHRFLGTTTTYTPVPVQVFR